MCLVSLLMRWCIFEADQGFLGFGLGDMSADRFMSEYGLLEGVPCILMRGQSDSGSQPGGH